MDRIFQKYLARHLVYKPELQRSGNNSIRVVIPVYLEEDHIEATLNSLERATGISKQPIEVILVLNYSESDSVDNKSRQLDLFNKLVLLEKESDYSFQLSLIKGFDLPAKHAGVGLARKIGMDYAMSQFATENQPRGIVLSLDADCLVQSNYFVEVSAAFDDRLTNGCTLYFEHITEGLPDRQKEAIEQYELHLRYYLQALKWTGHPYAFHTVGSCFAVTAEAYARAGGMPRKQAGEDFYFLQKVISLGHFKSINSTCVFPSARISDRVPFGTGPTVGNLVNGKTEYLTYNLQAFIDLKALFDIREKFFKVDREQYMDLLDGLSGRIRSFLINSSFFEELQHVNTNCSGLSIFSKRFFEVFDAFKVVKYLNYVHAHFLERTGVFDAALDFLDMIELDAVDVAYTADVLAYFRGLEKN